MKLRELLAELEIRSIDLPQGEYRGIYNPTGKAQTGGKSVTDLWDIVDEVIELGYTPKLEKINIDQLLATQDWLSSHGSDDGPVWPEYKDYPVVLELDGKYYILDGHHRVSRAKRQGSNQIQAYLFLA